MIDGQTQASWARTIDSSVTANETLGEREVSYRVHLGKLFRFMPDVTGDWFFSCGLVNGHVLISY